MFIGVQHGEKGGGGGAEKFQNFQTANGTQTLQLS